MDALKLLEKDHKAVAELFKKIEATDDQNQKLKIFEKIKLELTVHIHIEEVILYPACKEHDELKNNVLEALEEHKQIKALLRETENLTDGSEKFDAKVKVTKEDVEHHVKEEETEFFPKIRKLMSAEQLEEMGLALEKEKNNAR